MKIYTEEQVRESFKSGFRLAMETDGGLKEGQEEYINSLTLISLPSEEEIEESSEKGYVKIDGNARLNWINGAKWMKEQILNKTNNIYGRSK